MSEGYKIGAGYDVPLLSLSDIESLPGSGEKFAGPKVTPLYSFGQKRVTLARSIYTGGFPAVVWEFGFMYYEQWAYLSTTFCAGGLSGEVTIYTNIESGTSFSRLNAIMQLPQPSELRADYWYKPVAVTFSITGAAA